MSERDGIANPFSLQREPARTLAAGVFARLRADILSSKLPPGSKLRFDGLREAYGVGISPLREALSQLVATRLVTTEGQRGFRVAPASVFDISDVAMVRQEVEGIALRASIGNGDDAWEANVVAARHRLALLKRRNGAQKVDEELWEERHREFHFALISACRSPWLLHLHNLLNDQFDRYRRMAAEGHLAADPTSLQHEKIVEAALGRDADLAVRLLHEHIGEAAEIIIAGLSDVEAGSTGEAPPRIKPRSGGVARSRAAPPTRGRPRKSR